MKRNLSYFLSLGISTGLLFNSCSWNKVEIPLVDYDSGTLIQEEGFLEKKMEEQLKKSGIIEKKDDEEMGMHKRNMYWWDVKGVESLEIYGDNETSYRFKKFKD